ncbi:hypothetical protein [Rhizobium wenxiniae]|uniref:hypothetical protein n=1 Tax=Rhizobium wenxiniae TaxID=1737357 RepID=UPI003C24DAFC
MSRRLTYRQKKERRENLQLAALAFGVGFIGLPLTIMLAMFTGDTMAKTNYSGAIIRAAVSFFA